MIDNAKLITMMQDDNNYVLEDGISNSLCDKARNLLMREIVFNNYDNGGICIDYLYGIEKLTPIEQIFYIAYNIYCNRICKYNNDCMPIHFCIAMLEEIIPQSRINYKEKKYAVDFVIDFTRNNSINKPFYPKINKLKYAIELDGFDYHSHKKQMQYDYERENNLKELGYSVIRFTGSQIYKEPYTCIEKLINIIINDIEKEIKNGN